ncbi:MAG: phage virion morphogenesis protein [Rhodospirillaceae bacterium]|nr:phage virion morphogenesis protein [Rhodospirillales bacterium]
MDEDPLAPLERWIVNALTAIDPAARRVLMRDIGRELRRRNQRRIAAQTDPDGTAWAPRKRNNHGKVRKTTKMLQGFRDGRRLRLKANAAGMELGFDGRSAMMASIHHYGEVAAVARGGARIKYPARQLLGMSDDDREFVYDRIATALKATK